MMRWMKVEKMSFFPLGNKISAAASTPTFQVGFDRSWCDLGSSGGVFLFCHSKNDKVISLADGQEAGFSANSQQLSV